MTTADDAAVSSGNGSSRSLSLSLFLVVLAFFIVLTAISSFEDHKVSDVLTSLEETFTDAPSQFAGRWAPIPRAGPSLGGDAVFDAVERVTATEVALIRVDRDQEDGALVMTVPVEEIFDRDGQVASRRRGLIQRLAQIIGDAPPGSVVRLDMILKLQDGAVAEPVAIAWAMQRAESAARALIDARAPPRTLSVGIDKGDPRELDLVFRVEPAEAPQLDFDVDAESGWR